MDNKKIAKELISVAKELVAKPVQGKTGMIVLREDDFSNKSMWHALLEAVGEPFGEEVDFNDPEEVHLRVSKI